LRRFAGCADEQQQRHRRHHSMPGHFDGHAGGLRKDGAEIERRERAEHQKQPQQKTEITDAIHPERLVARVRRRLLQEEKSDQQIAREPHAFPADEHQRVIRRQHQDEHEKHEQIQIREKARVAGIVRHVRCRINMDKPADAGDHQQHHQRELIDLQREIRAEAAGRNPCEVAGRHPRQLIRAQMEKLARKLEHRRERQACGAERDHADALLAPAAAEQAIGRRAQQGQQRNDPQMFEYGH
jgi:hypothetical protein